MDFSDLSNLLLKQQESLLKVIDEGFKRNRPEKKAETQDGIKRLKLLDDQKNIYYLFKSSDIRMPSFVPFEQFAGRSIGQLIEALRIKKKQTNHKKEKEENTEEQKEVGQLSNNNWKNFQQVYPEVVYDNNVMSPYAPVEANTIETPYIFYLNDINRENNDFFIQRNIISGKISGPPEVLLNILFSHDFESFIKAKSKEIKFLSEYDGVAFDGLVEYLAKIICKCPPGNEAEINQFVQDLLQLLCFPYPHIKVSKEYQITKGLGNIRADHAMVDMKKQQVFLIGEDKDENQAHLVNGVRQNFDQLRAFANSESEGEYFFGLGTTLKEWAFTCYKKRPKNSQQLETKENFLVWRLPEEDGINLKNPDPTKMMEILKMIAVFLRPDVEEDFRSFLQEKDRELKQKQQEKTISTEKQASSSNLSG